MFSWELYFNLILVQQSICGVSRCGSMLTVRLVKINLRSRYLPDRRPLRIEDRG